MPQRPARPANMPWMIPYLTVSDASKAADFYASAFGWEKGMQMPGPDGKIMHGEMRYRDMVVMFAPQGAWENACKTPANRGEICPICMYVYVDDVDAAYKRAIQAGAKAKGSGPTDMFWGDRCAQVIDPDGYAWSLATNVADFDPSKAPK